MYRERRLGPNATAWPAAPSVSTNWRWRVPADEAAEPGIVDFGARQGWRTPKMARVEAALLVASGSLSPRKLIQAATLVDSRDLTAIVERLNAAYDARGTAFRIERVAGGYRLLTRPGLADWLGKIFHRLQEAKLSPPALETLSIVAYRQPVTRADVEVIRGVSCAEMLKYLMERGLVRIAGEDNSLGRPFIYETTRAFLEKFGLGTLDDLPNARQLRRKVQASSSADSEEDTADQAAA